MQTLYASVQGNARAKKWEWVGRGVGGEGMGDFWDSIGNVNEAAVIADMEEMHIDFWVSHASITPRLAASSVHLPFAGGGEQLFFILEGVFRSGS